METFYDAKQKYEAALSPTRLEGMETSRRVATISVSIMSPTRLEGMETERNDLSYKRSILVSDPP